MTPSSIYDLEAKIDGYSIISPRDISEVNELLYKEGINANDKKQLQFIFSKTKREIERLEELEQKEFIAHLRGFIRFYEFLLQATCFEDVELHKKYNFITCALSYINIKHPGDGFNLDGKIQAINFIQKKDKEYVKSKIKSDPIVKLPVADPFHLSEDKIAKLSEIISEINSLVGKKYDNDVAVKAMLQIRDIMMKSEKLKTSAKNNKLEDFQMAYYSGIDNALIEGLEQNSDFFSLLLNNDKIKKEVLGIFLEEIYNSLKKNEE